MFVLLFFLGATIASFLNLCAYRVPRKMSIVFPSSNCEGCSSKIHRLYLIPVIGYILCCGRCKECGHKIPLSYMLSELSWGIMTVIMYTKFGLGLSFIHYLILISFLYLVATIDLSTMEVHMDIVVVFLIMLFITSFLRIIFKEVMIYEILRSLMSSLVFLFVFLIFGKMKWFGYGDSFVIFTMLISLSISKGILSIFLSFILGGVFGIIILIKDSIKKPIIPFCPFLLLGGIISILFSEGILNFYMSMV